MVNKVRGSESSLECSLVASASVRAAVANLSEGQFRGLDPEWGFPWLL